MKIHEIKQQVKNKNRFNLYDDSGFIGALGIEAVAKHGLKQGAEISNDHFCSIVQEDNEAYAFDRALHYLSFGARTQSDMERYLKGKQVGDEAIANTLEKLKNYGYINDLDFARRFVQSILLSKKEGRRAAEYKLKQKGIPKEMIEDALSDFSEEDETENAQNLYAVLTEKYKNDDERKRRDKIIRYMAQKGYDYDIILSVVRGGED